MSAYIVRMFDMNFSGLICSKFQSKCNFFCLLWQLICKVCEATRFHRSPFFLGFIVCPLATFRRGKAVDGIGGIRIIPTFINDCNCRVFFHFCSYFAAFPAYSVSFSIVLYPQ